MQAEKDAKSLAEEQRLAKEELNKKVEETLRVVTAVKDGDLTQSFTFDIEEGIDKVECEQPVPTTQKKHAGNPRIRPIHRPFL